MTVDYHKINQVVVSAAAVVPDVSAVLKLITTSPGSWYAAVDLANVISPTLSVSLTRSSLLLFVKVNNLPSLP